MQPVKPSMSADPPYARPPDGGPDNTGDDLVPVPPAVVSKPTWTVALEWALLIASALIIALLIKTFLFQAFYIPSDSMVPTLKTNDRVIVNKLSYKLHPVHRGDIVVFTSPPNVDPSVKDLVKRVIGLPGETIEGRKDGHVYINGKELIEGYLPKGTNEGPTFDAIKIPPD
jgi:signal peptidase I